MRTWKRKGYHVEEKEFDHDLHVFEVIKNGKTVTTIYPADLSDMESTIEILDDGADINGWEDGMGNTITI